MPNPLPEIEWKLNRARENLVQLNDIATPFLEGAFYTLTPEVDRKGRLVVRIGKVEPFPLGFASVAGEAAHHLRSALNYIAYALARPATSAQEKRIQFPILENAQKFRDNGVNMMTGAEPRVMAAVKSVQPYQHRRLPEAKTLQWLSALNNWDKHKTLAVAAGSIVDSSIGLHISGVAEIVHREHFRGTMKAGKILARFEVGNCETGAEIYPDVNLSLLPVFDVGGPKEVTNRPVVDTLRRTVNFIESEVVPRFIKFF